MILINKARPEEIYVKNNCENHKSEIYSWVESRSQKVFVDTEILYLVLSLWTCFDKELKHEARRAVTHALVFPMLFVDFSEHGFGCCCFRLKWTLGVDELKVSGPSGLHEIDLFDTMD